MNKTIFIKIYNFEYLEKIFLKKVFNIYINNRTILINKKQCFFFDKDQKTNIELLALKIETCLMSKMPELN